jgi:hypothetical protein
MAIYTFSNTQNYLALNLRNGFVHQLPLQFQPIGVARHDDQVACQFQPNRIHFIYKKLRFYNRPIGILSH